MDEHINIKFFLELDNFADFLLDGFNILLLRDPITKYGIVRTNSKICIFIDQKNDLTNGILLWSHSLLSLVLTANSPELDGLRERTNGGGRENRKVELLLLGIQSSTNIGSTTVVRTPQSGSLRKQKE